MKAYRIGPAISGIAVLCMLCAFLLPASAAAADTADHEFGWEAAYQSALILLPIPRATLAFGGCDGGEIAFGQPINGYITAGSIPPQCYYFEGSAGDIITARLTRLDGDLDPVLELHGPDGPLASDDDSGGDRNSLIADFRLPENGTYNLLIGSYQGSTSGQFELALVRTSGQQQELSSLCEETIAYGTAVSNQVPPWSNCSFTFVGQAGQVVALQVQRLAGMLRPHIDLVTPNGDYVPSSDSENRGLIEYFSLPENGTYVIQVYAQDVIGTGAFELVLWQLDACGGVLSLDETVHAEISGMTPNCTYEFYSPGFSNVDVRMIAESGNLKPQFQVFGPDDVAISDVTDHWSGNAGAGTYWVNTLGQNGTAGRFELTIGGDSGFRAMLPLCGAYSLESGDTLRYHLARADGRCKYTFEGETGSIVTILLTRADSNLDPYLSLYFGNNSSPEIWDDDGAGDRNSMIYRHRLESSGAYRIVVESYNRASKGEYYLSLWVMR